MTKHLHLKKLLALLLLAVAVMTGHQAIATDKTVTYTISTTVSGTHATVTFTPTGDGFSTLLPKERSMNSTMTSPVTFELNDGLILQLNPASGGNLSVENNAASIYFNGTVNFSLSNNTYYIKHVTIANASGNALTGIPNVLGLPTTSCSLDHEVDVRLSTASSQNAYLASASNGINVGLAFGKLIVTLGESPRDYSLNYVDAVHGQNGVTNDNLTTYNVNTGTFNINEEAFSRVGYDFAGLYNNEQHTQPVTLPKTITSGSAAIDKDQTFYASWTANTYTVTLDNQSATTPGTESVTATYDAAMPSITVPTRTGYTFGGYYTETNGGGTQYYNAEGTSAHNWDIAQATILYAQWTAHTYTVHFDANYDNNGIVISGTMSDQSLTYDQGVLTANAFTRIGYTFAGWNTQANGTGTTYTDQQASPNITPDNGATVTLYAQWNVINWEGLGSEDSPFVIRYASQLVKLADTVNSGTKNYSGKYFKLGNNIDMNGVVFDGIGNYNYSFNGSFNGDSKIISNVTINITGEDVGFFGDLFNATVKNLIIDNASITGNSNVGVLAGCALYSSIENCLVLNSSVSGTDNNYVGIIIGNPVNDTLSANYYYGCTFLGTANATNVGVGDSNIGTFTGAHDVAGARSIHTLTLPMHVTVSPAATVTYNQVTYYAAGVDVTLAPETGFALTNVSVTGTTATDNNDGTWSFTMPAADATVTATVTVTGEGVPYIDENGDEQYCSDYTCITGEITEYDDYGWYVVMGDVEMESLTFNSSGNFHLILCDGAHLHLTKYLNARYSGVNLNIYAQSGGSGTLTVNNTTDTHNHAIDIHSGTFTLNGGIVNCTYDATGGSKYGLYAKGVVVSGGSLTAISTGFNGRGIFINGGDLTVNGGTLTARCTHSETGYGIYFQSDVNITFKGGNVTASGPKGGIYKSSNGEFLLGWTNTTDSYYVSSYVMETPVSIQAPQVFWNGEEALYWSVYDFDLLDDKTLVPCVNSIYVAGFGGISYSNYNWIFIASPVAEPLTPSEVTNLVADPAEHYDFYRLNPSNTMWENIKANTTENHPDFTTLVNGRGYLYANYYDILLTFPGTLNTATEQDVPVSAGYNLVGNPFGVPAYLSQSYYTLNELGYNIEPVLVDDAIMPCMGVIVHATEDGYVHFSTTAPTQQSTGGNKGSLSITLSQVPEPVEGPARNGNVFSGVGVSTGSTTSAIDNAIITFSEGSELGKFYFGEQDANIYLTQGNEDYAIAFSEGQGEMPLNFEATKNGTYTITVNPEGVEMDYLHLIDNLTGADVDLLPLLRGQGGFNEPATYTFTAKTTDYASRFKLIFSANDADGPSTGSGTFAFISNGNIIVNGEGTLQIVDIMGRIVWVGDAINRVSTSGMMPGVYVLRLIDGENVRTQKIVVE